MAEGIARTDAREAEPVALGIVWLLCLVSAAVCIIAHALWIWANQERLPERIAIHWSGDGPDGFASVTGVIWIQVGMVGGLALFLALTTALISKPSLRPYLNHSARGNEHDSLVLASRLLPALSVGTSVFITVLSGLTLYGQFGLADARSASVGVPLLVGMLTGAAVGALCYWLLARPTKRTADR